MAAQGARRTKTDPATCATGNFAVRGKLTVKVQLHFQTTTLKVVLVVEPLLYMHYFATIVLDLSLITCPLRQMLFCRVTLGKSFLQFSAMKMAHAPPGHHSVIGRPSVNGLAYAEYVIYRGEQVNAEATRFFFSLNRIHPITCS